VSATVADVSEGDKPTVSVLRDSQISSTLFVADGLLRSNARCRLSGSRGKMKSRTVLGAAVWILASSITYAQEPPVAQGGRGRGGGFGGAFPQHAPADPAMVDRGKAVYGVHCAFCHGSDARGGEGGPNLIRSEVVLNDQNGETIAPIVQGGKPDAGMPKFDLSSAQVSDIAAFLHSFRVNGRDAARNRPPSVLVGDAKAGEQYFQGKCASCHSVTGDLKGLGGRITDAKALQQTWLAPGGNGRSGGSSANVLPVTVTVTLPSGQKLEGRLVRLDDFTVTVAASDGGYRSLRRSGDTPKVEVHDALEPHRQLLPVYTDKDIHDVTAYLATLK
jgi:cytochrome c oxidase cbb3-type subunit III